MQRIGIWVTIAGSTVSFACRHPFNPVWLVPEQRATLQVGALATFPLDQQHTIIGSAGASLVLARQEHHAGTTLYVYRAARPGYQTLLVVPSGLPSGHCISCVTQHYFVTVLP